jgi:formate dehydrogenase major subunit
VPTDEKVTQRYPLLLTTGRILSQYNVGAQTRRTENSQWHSEDRLESTRTTPRTVASARATGSA